jgi:hypothetical protein
MNGLSRQAPYVGLLTSTARIGDPERRGREHK